MSRGSKTSERGRVLELLVLAITILFFVYDLVADVLYEGEFGSSHFVIEFIVFVGVSMVLVFGVRDMRHLRAQLKWQEQRNLWLSGALAESINDQMDEWRLTRSEKDVLGSSSKDIDSRRLPRRAG